MKRDKLSQISIQSISVMLYFSVALITLVMFIFTTYSYHQVFSQRELVTKQYATHIASANDLRFKFQEYKQEWGGILLRGQNPNEYYEHLSQFYSIERKIYSDIKVLKNSLADSGDPLSITQRFYDSFYKLGRIYRRGLQIYNETLTTPYQVADASTKVFLNEPSIHLAALITSLENLQNRNYQTINNEIEKIEITILISFSVLLLVIFTISFLISKKLILTPIIRATHFAQNISSGNLDDQIEGTGSTRETDNLLVSLHTMQKNIHVAYEELKTERDRAERTSKAKSDFLSSMSHELRTPMNAILGFSQLMKLNKEELSSSQIDEYTDDILVAGNHLLKLINEVLDLSKIEAGHLNIQLNSVKVTDVLDECINQISSGMARQMDVEIITQSIHDNLYIYADPLRVKQVLMNLLSNAVKYNHVGGKVTILAEGTPENRVKISIQDTGPGIAPENIAKLFEPFERLTYDAKSIEGTGIGLTVTKRLVELMQGNIGVKSQPEQGSTFWFELPKTDV